MGDHGFTRKEERHSDACIRVPLIIAGPGIQQGTICHQPVQLEDICPTILDMINLRFPAMPKMRSYLKVEADQIPRLPGRSLLPLCQENTTVTGWRQAAYSGSCNASWSIALGNWAQTIRTDRYRYTIYPGQGGQLFDLQNDPDEQHNLVAEADCADIRQQLQYQLMELIIGQDYPETRRILFALGVH